MNQPLNHRSQRGVSTLLVMVFMTSLVTVITATLLLMTQARRSLASGSAGERGLALAEAGIEKAIAELARPGATYAGETDTPFGEGFFSVAVSRRPGAPESWDLVATGLLRDEIDPLVSRRSSAPELRVRIEIARRADDRPQRVRVTSWEARPAQVRTPAATRPASG
jgi:hypothetical protein